MAAYYQDGKLVRRSSGTTVKDEAQKKLRVALGDIDAGTAPPPGEIPTVATLCQLVLDDYTRNGRRSGRDVERAYGYLERFSGDRPAQSITVADVDAYIAARLAGRVRGGEKRSRYARRARRAARATVKRMEGSPGMIPCASRAQAATRGGPPSSAETTRGSRWRRDTSTRPGRTTARIRGERRATERYTSVACSSGTGKTPGATRITAR